MDDLFNPAVVERLYRDLVRPQPPLPKTSTSAATKKPITRADVDEILQRKRPTSPEELQHIIDHSKELSVSERERSQISVDMTLAMAKQSRQANGVPDNPSAEFIAKVLRCAETPYGLVSRDWVNAQLRTGAQAIHRCKNHRPPECQCWSSSRAILWQTRADGDKTPEGWAADRIYAFLEELELASRPERSPD